MAENKKSTTSSDKQATVKKTSGGIKSSDIKTGVRTFHDSATVVTKGKKILNENK